jgi:hypothetical protein
MPMTLREYLVESEFATKQLFDAMDHYHRTRQEIPHVVGCFDARSAQALKAKMEAWERENRDAIEAQQERAKYYFSLSPSMHLVGGCILQFASAGFCLEGCEGPMPTRHEVTLRRRGLYHCWGRDLYGLPLGLIVYAGRNQFAHWQDPGELGDTNKRIFRTIAEGSAKEKLCPEGILDPAFDLDETGLTVYAANILAVLGWMGYDAYREDMERVATQIEQHRASAGS